MRGRFSRKLDVLAKAVFLLWLLWLGYLLLAHVYFPSSSPGGEKDLAFSPLARLLSREESEVDKQMSRPLYLKPEPDNNALGEWGRAAHLNLSPDEKREEQDNVERYAINIYLSDKISLHRHIKDHRMSE